MAFLSLALAISLKLYPALLAAVLARGRALRFVLIFATVLLCAYAPYLTVGEKLVGFLPRYFSDPYEIVNLGLPSLLFTLLPPAKAGWVLRFGVLAVAVWMFLHRTGDLPGRPYALLRQVYLLVSVHTLLLYPAVYPWYLSWLVPLLCFFPSPGWLYFSCALAFTYTLSPTPTTAWPTPTWVLWLEYTPLYVLLAMEVAAARRGAEQSFPPPRTDL